MRTPRPGAFEVRRMKRPKLDVLSAMDLNNISDLQRSEFMLAEELDEANAEIKRLKEELRLRDAMWNEWGAGKRESMDKSKRCSHVSSMSI